MKSILSFFLFLISLSGFSQSVITGRVVNAADKKPVPNASVFLSNTVVGARTTDDGSFTLNNVKNGQYDLVVSFVGYETHYQTITVNNAAISLPPIELHTKTTELKEVRIGPPDPNRNTYYEIFKEDFLGRSENAKQCIILNPEVIDINFNAQKRILNASSDEFIIVENKALGYKIRYQLNKFIKDLSAQMVYYEGPVLFENLKGRPSQMRKWMKNRLEAYNGSSMHFLRSVIANQVNEEGFKVLRLIKKANTERPPDSLIRVKFRMYTKVPSPAGYKDSAAYWRKKMELPKILQYLVTKPLALQDYIKLTDNKDLFAMAFDYYPYIMYTKKRDENPNSGVYRPLDVPNYLTTIVTLKNKQAIFDRNGIFIDPASTLFEGAWAISAVADLLPVDYDPAVK